VQASSRIKEIGSKGPTEKKNHPVTGKEGPAYTLGDRGRGQANPSRRSTCPGQTLCETNQETRCPVQTKGVERLNPKTGCPERPKGGRPSDGIGKRKDYVRGRSLERTGLRISEIRAIERAGHSDSVSPETALTTRSNETQRIRASHTFAGGS